MDCAAEKRMPLCFETLQSIDRGAPPARLRRSLTVDFGFFLAYFLATNRPVMACR